MKMYRKTTLITSNGMTLIEVLIALTILAVTIAVISRGLTTGIIQLSTVQEHSFLVQQMNTFERLVKTDIQAASEPNSLTSAVIILGAGTTLGRSIDIYSSYVSGGSVIYRRTNYRYNTSTIQKGWIETNVTPVTTKPSYGTITNYSTVLESVSDKQIFSDITADATSDRRLIQIDLTVNGPSGKKVPSVSNKFSVVSRCKN